MDILNDVSYKYAKLYYKIIHIVGYTKITKSYKTVDFKYTYSNLHVYHFCVA
jgi:hypothetical protein